MASKNHNTLYGFLLIAAIMVGFMVLQTREVSRQKELQEAQLQERMRQDSLARAAQAELLAEELLSGEGAETTDVVITEAPALSAAPESESLPEEEIAPVPVDTLTISNDLLELRFLTRGAMPYSALVKDYTNYGGTPLYLYRGGNYMDFVFNRTEPRKDNPAEFSTEAVSTADMHFQVDSAETTASRLVLYTPLGKGRIVQSYSLEEGSYLVDYKVAFVGLDSTIRRSVKSMKMNYTLAIPRMEKGLRNEKQYSKLNYAFAGEEDIEDLGGAKDAQVTERAPISWVGYQQQFFSVILRCKDNFASGANSFAIRYADENDPNHRLMTCMSTLSLDYAGGSEYYEIPFEIYMGPNSYYGLKALDQNYEKIVPLGGWLVGWFTKWVIIPMFEFFHDTMGIINFGLIILLMTLVIKLIVLPLAYKSYSSSAKMAALRPEIEKINAKFPKQEDAMKKQQATMDLYRRAGVSPMGGCLPMLFQFPILWAMFRFFPASIELRQQAFLWADDLSTYDNILPAGFELPFIGHLSLFALLMAISMWFYSKVISGTQMSGTDPSAKMMKFMSIWMMPIMMFFICNSLSSGLSYYYLLSNLITMLETWIIRKWFVHPEELLAKVHASEGKPVQKSKWQLRLEEAQKMQRQMEQQKKNGKR